MVLWRISNYADLSGLGGLRTSGRWHTRGRRIVYLADHPASALLEMLVHTDIDLIPDTYQLLRVPLPAHIEIVAIEEDALPQDWREHQAETQAVGDQWLTGLASPMLRVPSAVVPKSYNFLLNPEHPDATAIMLADIIRAPFDPRLR